MHRVPAILTAAVAVIVLTAAPVAARVADTFNEPYSGNGPEALCGLDTINNYAGRAIGRLKVDQADNFVELDIKNKGTDIYTLPSTGLSVTHRYELLYKNPPSVDNGDGTVTVDQTVVGKSTWYDQGGALLLTENGPITFQLTIDFNVPPGANPIFTYVPVSSHGHHPDVCSVLTDALGA